MESSVRSPLHGHVTFAVVSLIIMCGLSGMFGTLYYIMNGNKLILAQPHV